MTRRPGSIRESDCPSRAKAVEALVEYKKIYVNWRHWPKAVKKVCLSLLLFSKRQNQPKIRSSVSANISLSETGL